MATLVNRAKVLTATTGTGTITLGSAVSGFQTFADAGLTNGATVSYVIEEGANWEIGTGTYSSTGPTLTRTPSESSNAGSAINLAGAAIVYVTAIASDLQNAADMDQGVATTDSVTFAGATVNGNITVTGTVDGRDVAADGTKLDGIEAGATADQTAAEIKTAYESNANTNAFTDAEQAKLAGIETGATADQTITAGTGLTGGGTGDVTVSHADTSTQGSVNNSGATVIQDVTLDGFGHVTALGSYTLTAGDIGAAGYDASTSSTGYFDIPAGTTAQRPASPTLGNVRYNTTEGAYEGYTASGWQKITTEAYPYTVEYLVVAGGGGGGSRGGDPGTGGGGAGGAIESSLTVAPGTAYTITIGGGGGANSNGGGSSAFGTSTIGGGRGGAAPSSPAPGSGGSGGGGHYNWGSNAPGSGTAGQGNNGGFGYNNGSPYTGGGGGGKSSVGANGISSGAGDGGTGITWFDGVARAGGGGGLGANGLGNDGGGDSSQSATANTGGGGGARASGGSGVVVLRYSGGQVGSGGTVTSSGGYTYHTFTSSGTYTA